MDYDGTGGRPDSGAVGAAPGAFPPVPDHGGGGGTGCGWVRECGDYLGVISVTTGSPRKSNFTFSTFFEKPALAL